MTVFIFLGENECCFFFKSATIALGINNARNGIKSML